MHMHMQSCYCSVMILVKRFGPKGPRPFRSRFWQSSARLEGRLDLSWSQNRDPKRCLPEA
jgi:hypothetical protein